MAKLQQFKTPVGKLEAYSWINRPDTKFNERGIYKANVTFDASNTKIQEIIKQIDEAYEENLTERQQEAVAKKKPAKSVKQGNRGYEFSDDESTVTLHFTAYGDFKDSDTGEIKPRLLKVVDKAGKPMEEVPALGEGTKVNIASSIKPYYTAVAGAGVKLTLSIVRLVNIVPYSAPMDWGDEDAENEEQDYEGGFEDSDEEVGAGDF